MIIYADGNGKILNAVQERVFQGAAGSYRLGLVSPFPETDAVTASFTLSGGKTCPPVLLSTDFSLSGIRDDNGAPLVVRSALFPSPVLSEHGRVKVQFHVRYNGQAGAEIFALEPFVFTVERGVRENLPESPSDDVYGRLLSAVSSLNADVLDGRYGARSLYCWKEDSSYGKGELVFAVRDGGEGCIVRSLVAENAQPPFADGQLNRGYWQTALDFSEMTAAHLSSLEKVKAEAQALAEKSKTEANRAESYAEKLAQMAGMRVETVENLPARGESGVLYLRVDDAGESLFELFTYASGAWQSKGSVALHLSGSRAFVFTLKAQNWAQNKQVFTAEGLAAAEISVYPDDDSAKEYLTCGVEASAESGNVVFTAKRAPQSDLGVTLVAAPMTDELYAGYYSKRETDAALTAKQDVLSFDAAPTQDSTNALSSGAVYLALEDVRAEIQEKTPKYEAGKGLAKTDNTFSVVLDAASDEALRLTSAGLRLDLSDYSTTVESDTKLSGAYTRINSVATLAEGNAERIAAAEQTAQNHEETLSALETQAAGMLGRIAALEEGASFTEELVLPVSAWQNKTAVFDSAALAALSSLTAGSFVGAAPAAGYAAAFLKNNVRLVSVGAGTLTFTADTVPSTELRAILTAVI